MIRLHNTLTGKVEDFKPLREGEVEMYHCGPTVYDSVHIGNLRSFILADILRRTFEYEGFRVKQVMNITDVGIGGDSDEGEDKMVRGLRRENKPITLVAMKELADFYTEKFLKDLHKLNIESPDMLPKASEHIAEDIQMVQELEKKGFIYKTTDGMYFDTEKDPHYGKLGGLTQVDESQSRIGTNSEKKNSRDFAVWKFNTTLGFPSPWGQGFPGWHIECSAMSTKYLGHTFDIHTGGIDLAPIHHNNEIAQSENACGCEFVHYWLHNEFVNLSGEKMAKSEGNILTLKTLEEKNFSPLAYRYFLLLSHYRTQTNFTWEALEAAQNAYRKVKEFYATLPKGGHPDAQYKKEFAEKVENDLNTPEALAVVWKLIKDDSISGADKRATLLDFDNVLGLKFDTNEFEMRDISADIQSLLDQREEARKNKDFKKSDELRDKIKALGFEINDTDGGQKLSKI